MAKKIFTGKQVEKFTLQNCLGEFRFLNAKFP